MTKIIYFVSFLSIVSTPLSLGLQKVKLFKRLPKMWPIIIGWIVWGIVAFLAISFACGCRSYSKSGQGFQWTTGVQTFFWWVIAILFLIFEWNKLHMLWIAPILFFFAQLLVLGKVPLLSPIILFATRILFGIILIGVEKPEGL